MPHTTHTYTHVPIVSQSLSIHSLADSRMAEDETEGVSSNSFRYFSPISFEVQLDIKREREPSF